jgi:hypothetical protein
MKSKLDTLKYNRRRAPARGAYRLLPDRSRRWLPFVLLGIVVVAALIGLAAVLRAAAAGNGLRAAGEGQTATVSRQLATGEQPTVVMAGEAGATETALPPTATPIPSATAIPMVEGTVGTFTQKLRLRAAPNVASEVLDELAPGTALTVTTRTEDGMWYAVSVGAMRGWVMAQWVDADAGLVPVSEEQSLPFPTAMADDDHTAEYQYVSGITPNVIAIFREGMQAGNRADVFSKVGDSITANEFFLVPVGNEDYALGEHQNLQAVIDYYLGATARDANSFANTSLAAQTGWSSADVLDAENADPDLCEDGESPLACEYQVVRPSIALIMLGTNDLGRGVDEYEASMRQVIEITLDRGIVPVISTIPPLLVDESPQRQVHEYNGLIVRLAREYNIPLWDYWAAMNLLPHYGLWEDGAHPNWSNAGDLSDNGLQFGMNVRNLTALQALDAVWRALMLDVDSVG